MIVAGPARSGRSTVLESLALVAKGSCRTMMVSAIALRESQLRDATEVDQVASTREKIPALLERVSSHAGPQLLLVDDAESVDDPDGSLARLVAAGPAELHFAVAARADALRSQFGHWTQGVQRSRSGLLLNPDIDLDGALLGVTLPRRESAPRAVGRGYLVHGGSAEFIQVASVAR
jgi:S-DNA-T family DNA segregation ATPase FtsK/SpoIIIE